MNGEPSLRGVCSVVDCSSCPVLVAGACDGCRERDAAIGGNGNQRCAIVVCCRARGQDSCYDCADFPCSVFRSPSSLYIPCETANGSVSGCNVAALARSPEHTSRKFVSRLTTYLMVAEHRRRLGYETVTSSEFASALGIKPQLVRKDMLSLGHFGIPHVGFKLDLCIEALRETLNLKAVRNVVWMGLNGPYSPEQYMERFSSHGCRIVAIMTGCDKPGPKPESIGTVKVFDFSEVKRVVKNLAVVGAVIACDNQRVQAAADTLIELGITSILNLTPVPLDHPSHVFVKNIDLSEDIMLFSFYCGNT